MTPDGPSPIDSDDDEPIWPTKAMTAYGTAHARELMDPARDGGLIFEAFLPPDLAEWLLGLVEAGEFHDPAAAVFAFLGEMQELTGHPDLRRELLRRRLVAAAEDPTPGIPSEEVFARLEAEMARPRSAPAVWRRMPPEIS